MTSRPARAGGRLTGRAARRGGGAGSRVVEPEVAALAAALARAVEGDVEFDDYTRHLYSRDASMYSIRPRGVVAPRHVEDVVAAVRVAAEHGVAVLPRGAGTSLAGQTVGDAVVLDFSRYMSAILELDPATRTASVQPGVVQDQLNGAAAAHGLMFGPDTSTSNRATLGGMIGNNSAGSGSIRHGMTIDHVRALEVVLADASRARFAPVDRAALPALGAEDTLAGRLYRELPALVEAHRNAIATGFPSHWRRAGGYRLDRLAGSTGARSAEPTRAAPEPGVAGGTVPAADLAEPAFDLAKFVVGSEGTLVVVTEATVGLVTKPARTVIAVGHFRSTQAAIAATEDALACEPAAVELIDRAILDLSRSKLEYAALGSILRDDPDALLFVSFSGDDPRALAGQLDRLTALWRRHGHGYHTLRAETPAQQGALLKVRKAGLGLLMAASQGTNRPLAFVEDTAVPPERLADYTDRFAKVLDRHGMRAGFYGHCSVGCLHIRPFVDLSRPEEVARMRTVAEEIRDLVTEFGGANSSEHGDGLARGEFNRQLFGDELYQAMRQVKRLFDPDNRLNPGKIVDSPAMTDHLRDAALPPAPPLRTALDLSVVAGGSRDGGGMRGAADRCMNIGLCRKTDAGVMCPSYPATHHERDSTRGRANALVKALSSDDPRAGLGEQGLHEVLDLCLMCKACKSECPLSVDMATLKSEALHQAHQLHGVPLRSRLFAHIRAVNRLGASTAPLANLPARLPAARRLLGRALGIAPARPLPTFARDSLPRWFRRRGGALPGGSEQGTLTWLLDSFTSYTEPAVGVAAIELLERAGWRVRLSGAGCCGRAAYSKGVLDQAKRQASQLVTELAESEGPIVGAEPSCLLTLRDEHRALLGPDNPQVAAVAGRVRLVEELLVAAIDAGRLPLRADVWPAGRRILLHGHCHQKAEVGTAASVALLGRIPGVEVVELDAGCCGMAGSFGFEAEHYATSMTIGEHRLFPAVRAASAEDVVAATGVSCRQQIAHGTDRHAWHPAELVRAALRA